MCKRSIYLFTAFFIFCLLPASFAQAAQTYKNAIVVAAVGSSQPEAIESIEKFAKTLQTDYPDSKIVMAFTSGQLLKSVQGREPAVSSLQGAVTALVDEGITRIAVCALYVSAGEQYGKMLDTVEDLNRMYGGKAVIKAALPLAGSEQDVFTLASYLIYSMPADVKPGDAVIFVGHGSNTPGSVLYPALNWALFLQGEKGSLYMVVNLENDESVKNAMQVIKSNKRKVVWLVPLLAVYGRHAGTDIFNTDDKSLSSRMHDAGLSVRAHKQGLIANEAVANLWKAQLRKTMKLIETAGN